MAKCLYLKVPLDALSHSPQKWKTFGEIFNRGGAINFHCRCSYILRLYLTSQVPQTYLLLEVTLKLIVFEWDCNVERQNPIYDMNLYLYLNLNSNLHLNLYLYLYLYLFWIFICTYLYFICICICICICLFTGKGWQHEVGHFNRKYIVFVSVLVSVSVAVSVSVSVFVSVFLSEFVSVFISVFVPVFLSVFVSVKTSKGMCIVMRL